MSAWAWPATQIEKVVDGDTLDVIVTRDLGFGGRASFPVRLRLHRINAAAAKTKAGQRATARVTELLAGASPDVTTVKNYKYGGPDGTPGEYMAEVTLPDGRNLSDVLVAEKLAVYWNGEGPRPADS